MTELEEKENIVREKSNEAFLKSQAAAHTKRAQQFENGKAAFEIISQNLTEKPCEIDLTE